MNLRLLIAAESEVLRAGLASLMSAEGFEIAGRAASLAQALETWDDWRADALLVDAGAASLHEEETPPGFAASIPMVLLAESGDWSGAGEWLRSGIRGLLPRNAGGPEIAAALRAVSNGLLVLHPDVLESSGVPAGLAHLPLPGSSAQDAFAGRAAAPHAPPPVPLTPRETEVLRLLAEGHSNKIIAWRLGISEHTIKFHIGSIFSKFGVSSRTEAVAVGARTGVILL